MRTTMITATIMIIIAYLLGSLSSAILVCKFMGLPDPRQQGSGNPGAANVMRIGGKVPALLTVLGDGLKGFIPVLIAQVLGVSGIFLGLVAVAACIGHIFPAFFNFRGGKGVATAFGGLLALSPLVGLITIITWAIVLYIFRYASLASIVASLLMPVYALFFTRFAYLIPIIILAAFIIWRHWENIQRLRVGKETKVEF
jgi:acyl phosphate:glycerol-3-phosphate acyltransferase